MIEIVTQVGLPVDERLCIKKNRLRPADGGNGRRISIITGIHGDELEGQYVCWRVQQRISEHPKCLRGTVDVYPAMNPFGIDSVTRGIPAFDLDMNRIFPGSVDGDMNEYIAAQIIGDISGSDLALDIHASNIYLTEIPQIRINEISAQRLVPLAQKANVDFVWVHGASTVLESTLAYSLNSWGVDTLVVEMGVGMRITRAYGEQLTDGIFSLMRELGIWTGEAQTTHTPIVSRNPDEVEFLNAPVSGVFVKSVSHGALLMPGDEIGLIVDPLRGEVLDRVVSPCEGWLFTVREYPMVDQGSLMARILKGHMEEAARKGGAAQ
ncbi:MAG: succinylglutamate desuccinylase/aspartoacylase family protein [Clostridia bacterium]|nr:succinylglutamate desuccinylase/aspartoacylase family protein [Clostridia bacterium]